MVQRISDLSYVCKTALTLLHHYQNCCHLSKYIIAQPTAITQIVYFVYCGSVVYMIQKTDPINHFFSSTLFAMVAIL